MNKYIEYNSKKFLVMLLLICLVFFILIIKAFEYIPKTTNSDIVKRNNIEDINKPAENTAQAETDEETQEENKGLNITLAPDFIKKQNDENISENNDIKNTSLKTDNIEPLEMISDLPNDVKAEASNKSVELTPEEKVEKTFLSATKYKHDKQFVKAIEEYQKIPSITNDTHMIARSYEEIATIYAIVKRYGTALSYAQKAYNMSPSSSREMLLARLYYKTGDIDKATRRINNVLQRDFLSDN